MPDISITNIKFAGSSSPTMVQVSEAVAAFDVLSPSTTNKYGRSDALTEAKAAAIYIALLAADLDGYVPVIPLNGLVTLVGPTLVQGTKYVVSANAGKIAPRADLLAGQFITELFDGVDASQAQFALNKTGILTP